MREHRHPCCPCFSLAFPAANRHPGQYSYYSKTPPVPKARECWLLINTFSVKRRETQCAHQLTSPLSLVAQPHARSQRCPRQSGTPTHLRRSPTITDVIRMLHIEPQDARCSEPFTTPSSTSPFSRNLPPRMSFRSVAELGCSLLSGPSARPRVIKTQLPASTLQSVARSRLLSLEARQGKCRAFRSSCFSRRLAPTLRPAPEELLLDALDRECPGHGKRPDVSLREPTA